MPGLQLSLLAPGKTNHTPCLPRKTTTYILHVISITTHTHDRPKSIKKKNKEQIRRERTGKKREESEKSKRKGKKEEQQKQDKNRDQEMDSRKRKIILADPRN